jgi:hypothetical protein
MDAVAGGRGVEVVRQLVCRGQRLAAEQQA